MATRTGWSPGPASWKDDLAPISSADWNYDRAAHLLTHDVRRRAGGAAHRGRGRVRHPRVHVTGAGRGCDQRRPAQRHLQPRRVGVLPTDRRTALRAGKRHADARGSSARSRRAHSERRRRRSGRSGESDSPLSSEAPWRPIFRNERPRSGPGRVPLLRGMDTVAGCGVGRSCRGPRSGSGRRHRRVRGSRSRGGRTTDM